MVSCTITISVRKTPDNDKEQIDFHRFVLFFGHEFTDRLRFFSEVELEHSLAGDDKPGEVELEQAFVEYDFDERNTARAGVFLFADWYSKRNP